MLRVVGCIVERERAEDDSPELLMVHRLPHKPEGNLWGLPSGKVEKGESDADAIIREVLEETGIAIDKGTLELLGEYHGCTFDDSQGLIYPTFRYRVSPDTALVREEDAHDELCWVTPTKTTELALVHGQPMVFYGTSYWSLEQSLAAEPEDTGVFIANATIKS